MTDMGQTSPAAAAARALRHSFAGLLHLPGDASYDTERLAWMRTVDSHPAIIAEADGVEDVQAAVSTARAHGLPLAVQSTGHGAVLPSDGGLLLKTGRMNGVEVSLDRRTATVGPGALWSDVLAATAPHGLAPLSGTTSIGATGYTLGGGVSWLSRLYGYAADSLLSAEVVTADGHTVTADPDRNSDLHWALRGGGGNFGIVTSMEIRLHPVTDVYAGMSLFPVDRCREFLDRYRSWVLDQPDEMSTAVLVLRMPPFPMVPEPLRDKQFLALRVCYAGPAEDAEGLLKPLRETAGEPVMDGMGTMPFAAAGAAIAGPPPPPMAAKQNIDLFASLPDEVLDAVAAATPLPQMSMVEIRHWGGAMARPDAHAGPAGHRQVPFSVITTTMLTEPENHPELLRWLETAVTRMRPHATGGTFLNFVTEPDRTRTAYTAENFALLTEAKRTWDPDNVFRINHNIPPN